jgi:hypothetical protein
MTADAAPRRPQGRQKIQTAAFRILTPTAIPEVPSQVQRRETQKGKKEKLINIGI